MRLRRFPAQESPKKRSRKILRKTTKIEYLRQPFLTFFPLLHRWRRQSPKLLLGVWKEVIFKKQKIIQTTSESCFMIVLAIDVDYFICKGCKRPVEEHKCIESHTFIMSLLSPVTVDHLKYSLNCERFVELQLYCWCHVIAILAKNKSLQKFIFCSKSFFFDMNQAVVTGKKKMSMSSKEK